MPQPIMPDETSRHTISHDLNSNLIVEAAAGTGKTTSLVARMVNLLATGTCAIEGLVAVTFTRKAAAELRERFQWELRSQSTDTNSNRTNIERERLRTALERIELAFIGTFHSFCSLLLRERPIECNVEPGFGELEDHQAETITRKAWQAFVAELYSSDDRRLHRMRELGLKPNELESCFQRFSQYPDVDNWPQVTPAAIDLNLLRQNVRDYLEHIRALSENFPLERGTDKTMDHLEAILRKSDQLDWTITSELFELLELFQNKTLKLTQKCWHDKNVSKVELDYYFEFRQRFALPAIDWWYAHRYEFVMELLQQARTINDQLRQSSGSLNFQDLLMKAATALRTQPKLRAYYQHRFTHLLVDEFQDTDPIQAQVLAFLTATDLQETSWLKCVPRAGSLFLVGDPKQSIYRFRRADVVTYQQVKKMFIASQGKILTLSKNFRTIASVREWGNQVFETMFGDQETVYSPAAVSMQQGRADIKSGELSGIFILTIPSDLEKEGAIAYEADTIAQYIYKTIASGATVPRTQQELDHGKTPIVTAADFLIITRVRKFLSVYAEALDRYGIANTISGGRSFANLEELRLLVACLRTIDDPGDPLALVGLLRGPLFGFSDTDLFELKQHGVRFSFQSPVPSTLPPALALRLRSANALLVEARQALRLLPFPAAVQRIASQLGLLARCSCHVEANIVTGGLLKAMEWLRAESHNFDSTNDLVSFLEESVFEADSDSCTALPPAHSAVRIMNLHKAKGLEAPIVFLANTYGQSNHEPSFHVDRGGERSAGYLSMSRTKGEFQHQMVARPSGWEDHKNEEAQFETAEQTRLLYVACTRAATQLVVSVAAPGKARFSAWHPLHDHLSGFPELEIPKTRQKMKPVAISATGLSLSQAQTKTAAAWKRSTQETYSVIGAKQFALSQSQHRPDWRASGDYGPQWGTAIHRLLELKMDQPEALLDSIATALAQQLELGSNRSEEMLAAVEAVAASEIWARARSAKKVYTEIPFDLVVNSQTVPTIARGVIDLCFAESDGWVIVDYKTDDIEDTDLTSATQHYAAQLNSYSDFWETITGQTVLERGLYFTKLNRYVIAT